MTTFRNFKNQSYHFRTIFSNPSNRGVTSHIKIKTLRYFRLRSIALERKHNAQQQKWINQELK